MNKSKTDVSLNQSKRLKLLRNEPITGTNGYGKYYLYPVVTEQGSEESFFAPEPIHDIIQEQKLKAGDEFILSRVQNGSKNSSKLELSIVGKSEESGNKTDNFRTLLLQSIRDAADIVKEAGIQFSNDELQKLATTLFIQRTR
ncbi:MAG: hypothetical protein JXA06_02310 [Bacteroidetes bacterium]|nr:hypothetical protein [Bacteroidota bacterium]